MGKLRHRRRDSIREERRNGVANGSVQSDVELSSRSKPPMPSVVVGLRPNALPERLQDVGEPVGGDERNATKPLDQAKTGDVSAEIAPRRSPVRVRLAHEKPPQIASFLLADSASRSSRRSVPGRTKMHC